MLSILLRLCLQHTITALTVCYLASLLGSTLSDVMWEVWNQTWWKYLHHRNWQMKPGLPLPQESLFHINWHVTSNTYTDASVTTSASPATNFCSLNPWNWVQLHIRDDKWWVRKWREQQTDFLTGKVSFQKQFTGLVCTTTLEIMSTFASDFL